VSLVKDGQPKPKDVMKAAVNIDFLTATYQQSYRAVHRKTSEMNVKNQRSYQLIMPYMRKLLDDNPGSTALAKGKDNGE
jgi:hypothetical protein